MLPIMPAVTAPSTLFVEITSECNLRCQQCHLWRTVEPRGTLSTAEKVAAIREFVAFTVKPNIVLTGGEPTLKREEFFTLTRLCRELEISCAANTNGTLLQPADADQLVAEGPKYFVPSIDSHRPDVHDYIRGVRGTFDKVTALVKAVHTANTDGFVRILPNLIVCDLNFRELKEFASFASELGAQGVMFQMLSRTFARTTRRDRFFDAHLPRDLHDFDAAMDALILARHHGDPIVTTENDIRWMKQYVRSPDFIGEQVCGSHERNMMLDMAGNVQLCFSMRSIFDGRTLGNIRDHSLRDLWTGVVASDAREVMSACRRNCGMLNCHRKPTI